MTNTLKPNHQGLRVADLLNEDRSWNIAKVREVATPADAHIILQIKVAPSSGRDALIWPYTADGQVTARSAYHIMKQDRDGVEADLASQRSDQTLHGGTFGKPKSVQR